LHKVFVFFWQWFEKINWEKEKLTRIIFEKDYTAQTGFVRIVPFTVPCAILKGSHAFASKRDER
jgi:hypothetical protein